jgi:hypothetical protein
MVTDYDSSEGENRRFALNKTKKTMTTSSSNRSSRSSTTTTADAVTDDEIAVFYNVFIANEDDVARVRHDIIDDQMSDLKDDIHGPVYVTTLGVPINISNTISIQHFDEGNEMDTLHALWEYCNIYPTSRVVYLHSKGSYHPKPQNDKFRKFLTRAALSTKCADATKSTSTVSTQSTTSDTAVCHVCSARFSPLPHAHVPGNMWLAQCSYIVKLIDPYQFETAMDQVYPIIDHLDDGTYDKRNGQVMSCRGLGRYGAEHWIGSHPELLPCDLYIGDIGVYRIDLMMMSLLLTTLLLLLV